MTSEGCAFASGAVLTFFSVAASSRAFRVSGIEPPATGDRSNVKSASPLVIVVGSLISDDEEVDEAVSVGGVAVCTVDEPGERVEMRAVLKACVSPSVGSSSISQFFLSSRKPMPFTDSISIGESWIAKTPTPLRLDDESRTLR